MPKVPYPYEVNGKLVTENGSLIPICSLSNRSLLPSLTVLTLSFLLYVLILLYILTVWEISLNFQIYVPYDPIISKSIRGKTIWIFFVKPNKRAVNDLKVWLYFDNLYDKRVIYPKCPFCSENILTASAAAGLKEGTKNLKSLSSLWWCRCSKLLPNSKISKNIKTRKMYSFSLFDIIPDGKVRNNLNP